MTSLILGIVCIYLAVVVLRMSPERLREDLSRITGSSRNYPEGYLKLIRALFGALGLAGAAIILLRFWN